MAIYDKKPSIYEANGDGSYTYRWDIKEVEIPAGADTEETTTKWECQEVVVWGTVTSDKLTEAVINEYNAATMGIYGAKSSTDAQPKIAAYKAFLSERAAIKRQIDDDCATLNIQ